MKQIFILLVVLAMVCQAGTAQIYVQDFEATGIPDGWSTSQASGSTGFTVGSNTALSSAYVNIPAHDGNLAAANDDECNCDASMDYLISPEFDLSASPAAYINIDYFFLNGDYEGADEQAFLEASVDGGATWTPIHEFEASGDGTTWENSNITLGDFAGEPSIWFAARYNDGGGWNFAFAVDNFSIREPEGERDLVVTNVEIGEYAAIGDEILKTAILNNGAETVTELELAWSVNGSAPISQTFTGLDLAFLGEQTFTFDVPVGIEDGAQDIEVTIVSFNGSADDNNPDNNLLASTVVGVSGIPTKYVLVEEGTGTWCGWCPRGHVFNEYMEENYPEAIVIAVHNGDPMTDTEWDGLIGQYIGGYPSGVVDRAFETDPQDFEQVFLERREEIALAEVGTIVNYNAATREVSVEVTGNFITDISGTDYRFNAMVVEMHVTGTASSYNQVNYYAGGSNGAMGGYENAADPVPAADMVYDHVGRKLLGGTWGVDGSLPDNIERDTPYSHTFSYTLPDGYNQENIRIVGVVQKYVPGNVYASNIENAFQVDLPINVNVVVDFSTDVNNETGEITITDNSSDVVSWSWDLGNGDTAEGPGPVSYTYTENGTYDVCLTTTDATGATQELCETVVVAVAPTAAFNLAQTGLNISLTDQSVFTDNISWDLGDGTMIDDESQVSHTYIENGTYTVCLTATNAEFPDVLSTICQDVVVDINVVVDFSTDVNNETGEITITDNSSDVVSWSWDLGNGDTAEGPGPVSYTYTENGTYDVCLTTTDATGATQELCETVVVAVAPTAAFDLVQNEEGGTSITLTDQSVFTDNISWDLGDGTTVDGESIVPYNYEVNGTYEVCLTATNEDVPNSPSTVCEEVIVNKNDNTSLNSLAGINQVTIAPVPANDVLNIKFNVDVTKTLNIVLTDVTGKTVRTVANNQFTTGTHTLNVNTAELASGVYIITFKSNEQIASQRFVVSH